MYKNLAIKKKLAIGIFKKSILPSLIINITFWLHIIIKNVVYKLFKAMSKFKYYFFYLLVVATFSK